MFEILGITVTWIVIVTLLELLCFFGFIMAAVEAETGLGAGLVLLIGAAIVHWTTPINVIELFKDHLPDLLMYASVYTICGIVYAIVKFGKKIAKGKKTFDENYESYHKVHPEATQKDYIADKKKNHYNYQSWLDENFPMASRNKRNIGFWFAWWPFCLLEFLYVEFFKNFAKYLANMIDMIYAPIKRKMYGDIYDDLRS